MFKARRSAGTDLVPSHSQPPTKPESAPPPAVLVHDYLAELVKLQGAQSYDTHRSELLTVIRGLMLSKEWRYTPSFVHRYCEEMDKPHTRSGSFSYKSDSDWDGSWEKRIPELADLIMRQDESVRLLFEEQVTQLALMVQSLVPASAADYEGWLGGYMASGGQIRRVKSDWPGLTRWYRATADFRVVELYGSSAISIVVPTGVEFRGGPVGHSTLYLMAGFRSVNSFGKPELDDNLRPHTVSQPMRTALDRSPDSWDELN